MREICTISGCLKNVKLLQCEQIIYHFKARDLGIPNIYTGCPKKGIDKKLLFGAAQGLNLQFLNIFGFSISVNFVWCII